jgi:Flp pilus assembly protein TadG
MLLMGRPEISLGRQRGAEGRRPVLSGIEARTTREGKLLRRQAIRAEQGQTLIVFVVALPLIISLIALVADGSNLFANKRSVQNVADATALAVARDLPANGTACVSPCPAMQADATTYSNSNNEGPTADRPPVDHPCADSADTNCYLTPYKGDNSSVQIRVKRHVTTFIAGFMGLSSAWVQASAAVGLGGVPSAAGNVTPIGVDKANVCLAGDTACFNAVHTLNFQNPPGYSLLDLDQVSPNAPIAGNTAGTQDMVNWVDNGHPGLLPANAWYGAEANAGGHNGMRGSVTPPPPTGLLGAAATGRPLLIPVFGQPPGGATSPDPATGSYWVIGFAAFVIDPNWNGVQNWKGNSTTGTHTLTGKFVDFIAAGVSGGPPGGPNDFGVHVVTLNE